MKFVLPDLCDKYGDSLQVLSPMLKILGQELLPAELAL